MLILPSITCNPRKSNFNPSFLPLRIYDTMEIIQYGTHKFYILSLKYISEYIQYKCIDSIEVY